MNTSVTALATTLFLMTSTALAGGGISLSPSGAESIHLQDGRLLIGGKTVVENLSLAQTRFSYLFIYVPDFGLLTIATREFPGAARSGRFGARRLDLTVDDLNVRIESRTPILERGEAPAWVLADRNYALQVKSVMVGYGDNESAPQAWERYVGAGR
jgi:hypothetical protein